MTQTTTSTTQSNQPLSLAKPMLIGALIAFLVISFFVFGVDNTNPAWGKYWMIRPLTITPLAGAMGGAFYAFINYQVGRGLNKTLAILLSLFVFIVALWLGIVLGLDGTMWN